MEVEATIEIPLNSSVKYELEAIKGAQRKDGDIRKLRVDRVVDVKYPFNYGFIDGTISEDGDCLDIAVICNHAFYPGSTISCRVVGMVDMVDEEGYDPKILAVPEVEGVRISDRDVDEAKKQAVQFFSTYKGDEGCSENGHKKRWSRVNGLFGEQRAMEEIGKCVERKVRAE